MGLKHRAVHMMLANPSLAPFELVAPPQDKQDWILIDHLMEIYKVKPSDYVESDTRLSIINMARTLASRYRPEADKAARVILVKDGSGAQKPAVREDRNNRRTPPHIEFCKGNLSAIEYAMLKLLADEGAKDNLFLVTGANSGFSKEGRTENAVLSFHEAYLEQKTREDREPIALATPDERELARAEAGSADGKVLRPEGADGVFAVTFANPEDNGVTALRAACLRCSSTEADTLLIELANRLPGNVTVHSGDSDLVAVFTAASREGVVLMLDNVSYRTDREMHKSSFGELLSLAPADLAASPHRSMFSSSEDRFRALCDVYESHEHLAGRTRELHDKWEAVLSELKGNAPESCRSVARYLYRGGIRGSVYHAFLTELFGSPEKDAPGTATRLVSAAGAEGRESERSLAFDLAFGRSRSRGPSRGVTEKRKLADSVEEDRAEEPQMQPSRSAKVSKVDGSDLPATEEEDRAEAPPPQPSRSAEVSKGNDSELPATEEADRSEAESATSSSRKVSNSGDYLKLRRLANMYEGQAVPENSHGRFLSLTHSGSHFHLIKKADLQDTSARTRHLIFMILCGTDYSSQFFGLGEKKLLHGAKAKGFPDWCENLKRIWYAEKQSDDDYYSAAMKLATLTEMPKVIVLRDWTPNKCATILKNMKYVFELWNLQHPTPGPEYGFCVRNGAACFKSD